MNKTLANYMKAKLQDLPFLDFVAGMVQTVEYVDPMDELGGIVTKRMPVAYDTSEGSCEGESPERSLVPDSSKRGILYFEDGGATRIRNTRFGDEWQSSITLVCWLNRERLVGNAHAEISTECIVAITQKFGGNPVNVAPFVGLMFSATNILPQDKSIFSKYTYDEKINQYLMPPFEFFAIRFNATYKVSPGCVVSFYEDIIDKKAC